MKRNLISGVIAAAVLLLSLLVLVVCAATDSDIETHRSCSVCGMDRKAYGYSRMLVTYRNDSTSGFCSLHCAVADIRAHSSRPVDMISVADRDSRNLIDATKAVWVIGGSKRGVMTRTPKWAFTDVAAANAFIAANGGTLADWQEAEAMARTELEISGR